MNRFAVAIILFSVLPASLSGRTITTLGDASRNREISAGLFNSAKGFGLSLILPAKDNDSFESFDVYADIYGFPTGRAAYYPGIKVQALHNVVLDAKTLPSYNRFIYTGIGACAGYVRDYEKFSRWETGPAYLIMNMGGIVCISGAAGIRWDFSRVVLDLSLQADAGFYMRRHETQGNMIFQLYKNGLYNSFYPQFKIMWKF